MNRTPPGKIIVVNGPSSSGKSTICRALQMSLDEPYLFSGIDFFTPMLPARGHIGIPWHQRTNDNAGDDPAVRWVFPEKEGDPVRVEFGDAGHRLMFGMHRAIAELALAGNNVIVEHVLLYPSWREDLLNALHGLEVWFVGVYCPPDVLEEREKARGDRVIGQARSLWQSCHEGMQYDVTVDTSKLTAQEAAEVIRLTLSGQTVRAAFGRVSAYGKMLALRQQKAR